MIEKPCANQAHGNAKRTNKKPRLDREIVFATVISPVPVVKVCSMKEWIFVHDFKHRFNTGT